MPTSLKNILVVDDDLEVLHLNHKMIREINQDYEVLTTNSPEDALQIAKDRLPDIIITDWYMPEISGIDLIKRLKSDSKTKDIPVIMTTGVRITPEDLCTALEAGAVDYIRKPIIKVELQARVNAAMLLSDSYKKALRAKDAELNENAILLAKNNEFLKNVQSHLNKLKKTSNTLDSTIESLNSEINFYLKSDAWTRFETSFQSLHGEFHKTLLKNHPNLTPKELKLAALLMLGMSSKNIASVFAISEDSVKVSRYRLRKKLDLSEKENLQSFLTAYS